MQPMALVTFLRGVNVGGHRSFRPSILANELTEYGAVNVGAAGTFVFRKRVSQSLVRSELLRCLPFESEVMICTGRKLIAAASNHPFGGEPDRPDTVRFISVLARRPRVLPTIPLRLPANGRWIVKILSIQERFVFGVYRREMKAIRFLGQIDQLFGVPVTTRNWNTVRAILRVLDEKKNFKQRLSITTHPQTLLGCGHFDNRKGHLPHLNLTHLNPACREAVAANVNGGLASCQKLGNLGKNLLGG